ncbi:MAG TPA: DNA alkylation repair protein, partial [Actinomycetota bacterium]|nr:DNA alkylation repair protein [Actinomycetota bacterium]
MQPDEVLEELRRLADPERLSGMARYGIATDSALGVTVTELRALARRTGRDHDLAAALWDSGIHEARILATIVDEPERVARAQAEAWVADVRSWDLCDGLCGNLLDATPFA